MFQGRNLASDIHSCIVKLGERTGLLLREI